MRHTHNIPTNGRQAAGLEVCNQALTEYVRASEASCTWRAQPSEEEEDQESNLINLKR